MIDSGRTGKNCYPQVFLVECQYVVKEKTMPKYIIKERKICSDESDVEDFDKNISDKENLDEYKHIMIL